MPRGARPGERRGGRQKGTRNHITDGIREIARGFIDDPVYRAALKARLEAGTAGTMESLLWGYGYGKPALDHAADGSVPTSITITF